VTTPNFLSPGLVEQGGRLSKPLADFLASLAATTSDAGVAASIADLLSRVEVLEAEDFPAIVGDGVAITVFGSAESGYEIRLTGGDLGPLPCQIFGS
jgi:hypothetical protein